MRRCNSSEMRLRSFRRVYETEEENGRTVPPASLKPSVKYKFKLTVVALANKVACIVYALMTRGGQYVDRSIAA